MCRHADIQWILYASMPVMTVVGGIIDIFLLSIKDKSPRDKIAAPDSGYIPVLSRPHFITSIDLHSWASDLLPYFCLISHQMKTFSSDFCKCRQINKLQAICQPFLSIILSRPYHHRFNIHPDMRKGHLRCCRCPFLRSCCARKPKPHRLTVRSSDRPGGASHNENHRVIKPCRKPLRDCLAGCPVISLQY